MAKENQLIRSVLEPSIILDKIVATDVEQGTASNMGSPSSPVKYSKQYGGAFPLVQINSRVFDSEAITRMEIRCVGYRPTASVTVIIRDKSFYSVSYPKDGDLLSLFIRSKDDLFKPIRNDYDITNVTVNTTAGGGENSPETMTVTGVLRIPGLDAQKCFSKKGSAYDALMQASSDLLLGFSSNEVDTQDMQTWICPFETVADYIHNVSSSSWKDNKSFFTYFIDHYYHVNYVNVDPLFSEKADIDEGMALNLMTTDYGKDSEQGKQIGKIVLSNWDEISDTAMHIDSYALQNYSASINLRDGYKKYVQYYDSILKEYQSIFVDPISSPGAEDDQIILKGRPNEDFYLSQVTHKWMGIQYGKNAENAHDKINYAKIQNYQNLVHLNKMVLNVKLQGCNFNLRRFQVIPVVIVIKTDITRKKINEPIDDSHQKSIPNSNEPNRTQPAIDSEQTPIAIDKFYTGFYVVRDIVYTYNKGQFRQECSLIRREWPTPPQTN